MGVPVITLSGYNFNSRCGESINRNLKMESLIANNEDQYLFKAINLSKNTKEYLDLRKNIFLNALESPLFNQKNFQRVFLKLLKKLLFRNIYFQYLKYKIILIT